MVEIFELNSVCTLEKTLWTSILQACPYPIQAAKTGNNAKRWVNCVNGNCASHGDNITTLIYAARACHLGVVRGLPEGGADVEAPIFNNNTALHLQPLMGVWICAVCCWTGERKWISRETGNTLRFLKRPGGGFVGGEAASGEGSRC